MAPSTALTAEQANARLHELTVIDVRPPANTPPVTRPVLTTSLSTTWTPPSPP